MNAMVPHRGGATVGYLEELGPVESGAVRFLRLWCDGPESRNQVRHECAAALGADQGRLAVQSLEHLCDLCVSHGRRPLMRHHVACKCLGADEACFAHFIGYASEGEREDAFLLAATIVNPNMAPALVGLAQSVGLALRRMALRSAHASETLH